MITRTAHADLPTVRAVDRQRVRMDPPAPNDPQDLLLGAWPGALVAMLLLGLLLVFGSVVSDGVRRGEQLRHQVSSASSVCDAQAPSAQALHCAANDSLAEPGSTRMPVAAEGAGTRLLAQQR